MRIGYLVINKRNASIGTAAFLAGVAVCYGILGLTWFDLLGGLAGFWELVRRWLARRQTKAA